MNVIAEGTFLRAGDGTFEGSADLETKTLQEAYGLAPGSFTVSDGSGFSRNNRVSPRSHGHAPAGRAQAKGLPHAPGQPAGGRRGRHAQQHLGEEPYKGRVLGKTGYINKVSALSGYVLDSEGRPVAAYSVMVNNCADLARASAMRNSSAAPWWI